MSYASDNSEILHIVNVKPNHAEPLGNEEAIKKVFCNGQTTLNKGSLACERQL